MRAVELLDAAAPIADRLEAFWSVPAHRASASWRAHLDIDEVVLATALTPEGSLALGADDDPRG